MPDTIAAAPASSKGKHMTSQINVILEGDGAWPDLAARQADIIHLAEIPIAARYGWPE